MPRIPDPYTSNVRQINPVTGITPQPDTGIVDRAVGDLGQQVTRLGVIGTDIAQKRLEADDQLAEARGQTAILRGHVAAEESFKDDKNYPTWQKRYEDQQSQILNDSAQSIKDPERRAMFLQLGQRGILEGSAKIADQARGAEKAYGLAGLQDTLNGNSDAAARSSDPQVRALFLQADHREIDAAEAKGWLSPLEAVQERRKRAITWAGNSVAAMPQGQIAQWKVGQKTNTGFDMLSPEEQRREIEHAQSQVRVNETAARVEADRAITQQKQMTAAREDATQNRIIEDATSANPQISATQIANDPTLSPEGRIRMLGFVDRQNKPDPPGNISRAITANLLGDMRLPEGNPNRITDMNPIYDAFTAGNLSREDFNFLRNELTQRAQSPDGGRFSERMGQFMSGMKAAITKSNPLMATFDAPGDAQYYRFQFDAAQKAEQFRKEGKNPFDLLNPASPEYLGREENISQYRTSTSDTLGAMMQSYGIGESGARPAAVSPLGAAIMPKQQATPAPSGPIIMDQKQADTQGIPTFSSPSDPGYVSLRSGQSYRSAQTGVVRIKP